MRTALTIAFSLFLTGFTFSQEKNKLNIGSIESRVLEERIKGYNELKLKINQKSHTETEKEIFNERLSFLEVQIDKMIESRYVFYNESPEKNKAEIEELIKLVGLYNPKIAKEIDHALNEL